MSKNTASYSTEECVIFAVTGSFIFVAVAWLINSADWSRDDELEKFSK